MPSPVRDQTLMPARDAAFVLFAATTVLIIQLPLAKPVKGWR
jgi:hypothetical protein